MNFYSLWHETRKMNIDDSAIKKAFLCSQEESVSPFFDEDDNTLAAAFSLLDSIPIETFLDIIKLEAFNIVIIPSMVPCFSSFENGAHRLNELLEFEPSGLTFANAGFQLIGATTDAAQVKYGETHAKLARMMNLVHISDGKPAVIQSTPWGSYLVRFEIEQKSDVLKKLLLRDMCIHSIIHSALNGFTRYADKVSMLSKSTAIRRRTNVKWLIEYILTGTECAEVLLNIDWEV